MFWQLHGKDVLSWGSLKKQAAHTTLDMCEYLMLSGLTRYLFILVSFLSLHANVKAENKAQNTTRSVNFNVLLKRYIPHVKIYIGDMVVNLKF